MNIPEKETLDWFTQQMMKKLSVAKNDKKPHWLEMTYDELHQRILDEAEELREAIAEGSHEDIVKEAADVANFALFVAHKAREEREK